MKSLSCLMTKQLRIHVVWFALLVFLLFTGVSDAKRQKKQSKTTAHIDQQTHKEAANGDIAAEPEGEDTGKEGQGGFANATSLIRNDDPCRACSKLHRGILHRVMDPEDFSKGCLVYGVLYCNTFDLYRGKEKVTSFEVNALTTPILLTPGSHMCFMVKEPNMDPEILCSENLNCRNEWWKALTRAVLCSHHGTELRREISGEPIVEEEREMVAEKVVDKPEKGGINIKLSGISEMPVVKLRSKKKSLFGG